MTKQSIIKRLLQKNWTIKVDPSNYHQIGLVLNACFDAGITWSDQNSISQIPYFEFPTSLSYFNFTWGLMGGSRQGFTAEDITEWFFKEINND